jgi:hypothetical protein
MRRVNYAAQTMLRFTPSVYSAGYGEAEAAPAPTSAPKIGIGADPVSAIAGAAGAAFTLTSTIIGVATEPKRREAAEKESKKARKSAEKVAKLQAQAAKDAAAGAAAASKPYTTLAMVVGVGVLVSGTLYVMSKAA